MKVTLNTSDAILADWTLPGLNAWITGGLLLFTLLTTELSSLSLNTTMNQTETKYDLKDQQRGYRGDLQRNMSKTFSGEKICQ